jgi:hypothetical protein
MVDLGQKGWKRFHLFYWNKVSIEEEARMQCRRLQKKDYRRKIAEERLQKKEYRE